MATYNGHALIVGVGADLPATAKDAIGMAAILRDPDRCAYPPKQVIDLIEEDATADRILWALNEIIRNATSDSTVIVYFSGHGVRSRSREGQYYLLPHDYDRSRLDETCISGAELAARLEAITAQKLVLILDCCHAGGLDPIKGAGPALVKAPVPPEALTLMARGGGRVLIASCKADEVSLVGNPYSEFTSALIESLAGEGASTKDGYVRIADVAMYTREMVPRRTSDRQHPVLNFQKADNFVVAYYAAGESKPKGSPFRRMAIPESARPAIEPGRVLWVDAEPVLRKKDVSDLGDSGWEVDIVSSPPGDGSESGIDLSAYRAVVVVVTLAAGASTASVWHSIDIALTYGVWGFLAVGLAEKAQRMRAGPIVMFYRSYEGGASAERTEVTQEAGLFLISSREHLLSSLTGTVCINCNVLLAEPFGFRRRPCSNCGSLKRRYVQVSSSPC